MYPSLPAVISITRWSDLINHNNSDTLWECHSRETIFMLSFVLKIINSPESLIKNLIRTLNRPHKS